MTLCKPGINRLKIKEIPYDQVHARYEHLYLHYQTEYGVMKSAKPEQNKLALAQFIAPIEISAYDDVAAQHYGVIRAHLERQGTPIGSFDMLIAAHALSINSVLITNNESEFKRVSNLKIENWAI
jgi:tRNA(fMet)-specific endonuclease VapC